MPTANFGRFLGLTVSRAALSVCFVASATLVISSLAGGQSNYSSATPAQVKAEVDKSVKMGEINGNTYYFKPAGGGIGQIFKILNSDRTKFKMVGVILGDKYSIQADEKSDFFALVTDKPASDFSGGSPNKPSPAAPSPTPQPPAQPSFVSAVATAVEAKGTAVLDDGGAMRVKLSQNGDTVVFSPGGKIVITGADGREVGKLEYVGPAAGGGVKQKAAGFGRIVGNLAVGGIKQGHDNEVGVNPDNYLITVDLPRGQKYGVNTENLGNRGTGDGGLIGITVAAVDVARQTKPDFSIPAENKLRKLADTLAH